jgi:hypothetical protein
MMQLPGVPMLPYALYDCGITKPRTSKMYLNSFESMVHRLSLKDTSPFRLYSIVCRCIRGRVAIHHHMPTGNAHPM